MTRFAKLLLWAAIVIVLTAILVACSKKTEPETPKGGAQPQTLTFSIGSGHPKEGQVYVTVADEFFCAEIEKRVAEKTNYRIKWNKAWGGSVAKLAEVLETVENGILDFGLVTLPFEPTKLFLQNFNYYIPFNSPDPVQTIRLTRKVFDEFPVLKEMFEKQYKQKFLALGVVGNYDLITTFPWQKVEDLKGKKIAAAGPNLPFLTGTGAVPVQSNLNEAYTSFQTGVYQGWIMYPSSTYRFKLHEVAPYHKNVGFGAVTAAVITVNINVWNKLPKEIQDIILQVAREYEIKEAEAQARDDKESLEKMKAEKANISDLPFEEKVKWANLLPNLPNEKAKEADKQGLPGSPVIKAYLKYLEDEGYKFPRKWTIE